MNALSIVILAICGIYMVLNFKHDIHMLQQNSYRPERYWRWLKNGDISSTWRMIDVAMIFLLFASHFLPFQLASLLICIVCITKIFLILGKKFKKPLVFTKRVWRIYILTALITIGGVVTVAITTAGKTDILNAYRGYQLALGVILLIAIFSWVFVFISLFILHPVEKQINNRYRKDAVRILKSMPELKVIGITGSYGKTSTKHYLHRILSENFETLMTPGSYNTPMGVIRTVREMMKPYTEIFICEMGAKQKGDIKEICDIVNPGMGIITAVGPMHLETFKTIGNVQSTKFELADAVPANGFVVVNDDFENCANRSVKNTEVIRYAIDNTENADYMASDINYSRNGTTFKVVGKDGQALEFNTKLVGESNVSNLIAAIIVALRLGVPVDKIQYAVSHIEQVEHRLNMKTTPGGVTIIDDAFNSNPAGAKMAIDVLSQFKDNGRRIVVTPGMIELGSEQFNLNKKFGAYLGNHVDFAIIVGEYNREAINEGIAESGLPEENQYFVDSFAEAQKVLNGLLKAGDTVLYENDLPDSFK